MTPNAIELVSNMRWWLRGNLRPPEVSAAYVDDFFRRHDAELVAQVKAGLDAAQEQAAQVDRLGVWREDHRRLREALRLARASGDHGWEARVARWLLRHARNEDVALFRAWTHSSRTEALMALHDHIEDEHEELEKKLIWVGSGQARFTEELHDELDHHLREEEAALMHLRVATFAYTVCGITQADLDGQAATFAAEVAALVPLVGEDAAGLLRAARAARRMDTRDIPLNRQAARQAIRAMRPDLSAAVLNQVVQQLGHD